MSEPDWSLWRSFGAVVEHGSLSGAARALGLSQPTLGRHIEALEQALGVSLFERTLTGLKAIGHRAAALRTGAQRTARAGRGGADGRGRAFGADRFGADHLEHGDVRLSCCPAILYDVRQAFPQIAIELVPSDAVENLLLREADIAVRMFRPTQLELITRHLGDLPVCACAHERYLAARGTPQRAEELAGHDLIGFDRSDLLIGTARKMGFSLNRSDFMIRTDNQVNMWELVKAGLGIGFAQQKLVETTPGMVRLLAGFAPPPLEVWLTTHRELFTSRRIRAIYDRLGEGLTRYLAGNQK